MPLSFSDVAQLLRNWLIREPLDYDIAKEAVNLILLLPTLKSDQMEVFQNIITADNSNE